MSFSSKQHQQPVFLEAFPPEGSSWLFVLVGFFNSYFFMHRLGSSVSHKKAVVVNTTWFLSALFVLRDRLASPLCAHLEAVGDRLLPVCFFSSVIFALLPWKNLTALCVCASAL